MSEKLLVVTTEHIPGHNYEVLGEVFGVTTQSRDAISDFGAGLKSFLEGKSKATPRCCKLPGKLPWSVCASKQKAWTLMPWS